MNFIVYAPPYNFASAGIRVLYELNNDLIQLGHKSEIRYIQDHDKKIDSDVIVIYPEVITNNPLNANHVVRYFLNLDGFLFGQPVEVGINDFILVWENFFYPRAHAQLNKPLISDIFNNRDTVPAYERTIDSTFLGKGAGFGFYPIPNTVLIGSAGPLPRKALASLLRQTRVLYTFDPLTMVIPEAIFSGAFVCVKNYRPFTDKNFNYPTVKIENDDLIIPLNYQDKREKYLNSLKQTVKQYKENLITTISKIQSHFGL